MFKKKFNLLVLFFLLLFPLTSALAAEEAKLIIFYSPSCHRCVSVKQEVMPLIQKEFLGRVEFEYSDISQIENYQKLLGLLKSETEKVKFQVPLFYMGGQFLTAEGDVYSNLRAFISRQLASGSASGGPSANLIEHFKSFVPAAVVLAGLADGINPCAFTVIVFFISFLALQGYRRRELFAIGSCFILAVFLTYLGLGLGLFNFFYRFRGFWLINRLFNWGVGLFCIVLGFFAIYDLVLYKRSGSTEGLLLQLPKPVKESIHRVVGFFYRRGIAEKKEGFKPPLFKLIASAFATGFLVSLLEAVCTGQVYLPTITFVLKTSELKLQAWGYLLLYNVMFIVPLCGVFILALLGTSSQQFSAFLKKHLGLIKIFMTVLFFGMGIFLLWRG